MTRNASGTLRIRLFPAETWLQLALPLGGLALSAIGLFVHVAMLPWAAISPALKLLLFFVPMLVLAAFGAPRAEFTEHEVRLRLNGYFGGEKRVLYVEIESVEWSEHSWWVRTRDGAYEFGPFPKNSLPFAWRQIQLVGEELERRREQASFRAASRSGTRALDLPRPERR